MPFREGIFARSVSIFENRGVCKRTPFCPLKKTAIPHVLEGLQAKSACKPWGVIRGGLFRLLPIEKVDADPKIKKHEHVEKTKNEKTCLGCVAAFFG